jgi:hypothetical protein
MLRKTLELTISLVLGIGAELYNALTIKTDAFCVDGHYGWFTVVAVT